MDNNKVVSLHTEDQDFEVLARMVNSPKQEAKRMARRKLHNRLVLGEKILHLAGAFSAGVVFTWLLIQFI